MRKGKISLVLLVLLAILSITLGTYLRNYTLLYTRDSKSSLLVFPELFPSLFDGKGRTALIGNFEISLLDIRNIVVRQKADSVCLSLYPLVYYRAVASQYGVESYKLLKRIEECLFKVKAPFVRERASHESLESEDVSKYATVGSVKGVRVCYSQKGCIWLVHLFGPSKKSYLPVNKVRTEAVSLFLHQFGLSEDEIARAQKLVCSPQDDPTKCRFLWPDFDTIGIARDGKIALVDSTQLSGIIEMPLQAIRQTPFRVCGVPFYFKGPYTSYEDAARWIIYIKLRPETECNDL